MVATPGRSSSGSSARALTYQDKMVKAHDKFWPEVDKVEPILSALKNKWNELSQSHLTDAATFPSFFFLAACPPRLYLHLLAYLQVPVFSKSQHFAFSPFSVGFGKLASSEAAEALVPADAPFAT